MTKYLKYMQYIIRHKWFVFKECWKMGIIWRGITHDLSKLRPSEFIPYAKYFYGTPKEVESATVKKMFDIAWLLHQRRNPHHWQYWLLREDEGDLKIIEMPEKYWKEMVCDWVGANQAITGERKYMEWYERNKEDIRLGPITAELVEEAMQKIT